jgi:DNA-binding LacI/PurR family transcriptional regulator
MSIFSAENNKLIGKESSRALLDIIANGFTDQEKIISIDHKLIERESVRSLVN